MADVYRAKTNRPVNDLGRAQGRRPVAGQRPGEGGRVRRRPPPAPAKWPSTRAAKCFTPGSPRAIWASSKADSIDALLDSAKTALPAAARVPAAWNYTWDLVLANPAQLAADFAAAGRSGIEGKVEEPNAIRGSQKDVYVAPGAVVHPMVVIDAEHGPVYLDEGRRGASLHPHRRAVLRGQEVDPAGHEVPRGQLDRPHVPRGRRSRGVDHPRLLQQVSRRLPRPRLRGRVGEPRRADDQQRPEERLLQRLAWSSTAGRPSAPARPRSAR